MSLDHRRLTLGELTPAQLDALVDEGETLFVEHKRGIGGEAFQLQKAMASFANMLGGWIIVGDEDRDGADGEGATWEPPDDDLVDEIRPYLQLDPVPQFAARVISSAAGRRRGVVRVYESADTPHVLGGTVFVREPAEDKKVRLAGGFDINPIRSSDRLGEMTQRGRDARAAAQRRLSEGELPVGNDILGLRFDDVVAGARNKARIAVSAQPRVIARLTPIADTARFLDLAGRRRAYNACVDVASSLVTPPVQVRARPFASGSGVTALSGDRRPLQPMGMLQVTSHATVVLDGGGMIGVGIEHVLSDDGEEHERADFDQAATTANYLLPPLRAALGLAERLELLGRYQCELRLVNLARLVRPPVSAGPGIHPDLPLGASLAVPAFTDGAGGDPAEELADTEERWAFEFARAGGAPVYRD